MLPNEMKKNLLRIELVQGLKDGKGVLVRNPYPLLCETLTRIGAIGNTRFSDKYNKVVTGLFQTCHVLVDDVNDELEFYLVHFKELLMLKNALNNRTNNETIELVNYIQRNSIAKCLEEKWGLINIENRKLIDQTGGANECLKTINVNIIPKKEMINYETNHKVYFQISDRQKELLIEQGYMT